jgi:hypothetical protein
MESTSTTSIPPVGTASITKLKRMPVEGGEERVILDIGRRGLWGVTARGVLYVREENDADVINLFQAGDGKIIRIGRLPFPLPREFPRMIFSRDGRWALGNQVESRESDLMMIEPFR